MLAIYEDVMKTTVKALFFCSTIICSSAAIAMQPFEKSQDTLEKNELYDIRPLSEESFTFLNKNSSDIPEDDQNIIKISPWNRFNAPLTKKGLHNGLYSFRFKNEIGTLITVLSQSNWTSDTKKSPIFILTSYGKNALNRRCHLNSNSFAVKKIKEIFNNVK